MSLTNVFIFLENQIPCQEIIILKENREEETEIEKKEEAEENITFLTMPFITFSSQFESNNM